MAAIEHYNNPLTVGDSGVPTGTLAADITNVSAAMSCSGLNAMVPNFRVSIENELILVTANIAGVQFVTRGIEGTTAVAHEAGASVYPVVTAASLLNNPLALTTSGDLPYLDASLNQARLAIGSATGILSSETGIPSWVTATGTGAPARATSPTFMTPVLGVAGATSLDIYTLGSAGATNYEKLSLFGQSGSYYGVQSLAGGTGTVRAIRFLTGNEFGIKRSGSGPAYIGFYDSTDSLRGLWGLANGASDGVNGTNANDGFFRTQATNLAFSVDSGTSGSMWLRATGNLGIGTGISVSARVHSLATTEQLRLGYDASNFVSHTVSSVGSLTVAPTGTNPSITLTPAGTGVVNLTRTVLAAGAAAAGAAPLKLTSGANLTTAEAGALEYNGTNLFFTRAGTTRETVMVGLTGTAPATSIGVGIVNYYGTAATNFLGDPVAWMLQNYGGTVYKIPLYT